MSAKRSIGLYLDDMLESIERIEKYVHNLTQNEFNKDIDKQDAVAHRLEIIGEAAKNIPQEFKNKYPTTQWREIARTRDKVTHHYFEIDLDQIWAIIQNDLQPLKEQVKEMLQKLDS